jgi:hypothetical protein
MILVDPDDLAAHPTRDLAQLAFLFGRGLIDRTDAQIDNRSAPSSPLQLARKGTIGRTHNRPILGCRCHEAARQGAVPPQEKGRTCASVE